MNRQIMNDYELSQKVLIFLIGISTGVGRYIPSNIDIPISASEFVEIPVSEFWGEPLVLVVLVFFYIMAEAMEPSWTAEFRGQDSDVGEEAE